jgi:choice-of-anchor B domain-containing protein
MKLKKLLCTLLVGHILTTSLIAQNLNVVLQSHLTYPNQTCANICGYVDSLGNEYALVGASLGMSIVDVTDPANPVEVIQIPGPDNLWREIKVRGKYAYVTTEGGGGLQIVNLSSLPNTAGITYHDWTGDGIIAGQLGSIHALHIDNQFVYLYGSNLFNGGAIVADLTDPWNPVYVGNYEVGTGNAAYVHDGYVRNDTLYAGHIFSGYFSVVDFTNKSNPVELVNQFTPSNFTHNTWLSGNSKVLFTTDEVDDSYLTSYDISDLSNINELDRIQSNPGSNSMVHNVHIINVGGNDYAVTSWYADGFTIVDAGRPQNLVQVGNYDTYAPSGPGSDGAWGVYPFLPSGTIVVSNIDEGLFVFTPTYTRACYLEGHVTTDCGGQLNNVQVTVTSANINETTDIEGLYKTGTSVPGTYNVTFSKPGYVSQTINGVVLSAGNVTTLDVQMSTSDAAFTLNGTTTLASATTAIPGVQVSISNSDNSFNFVSDANGEFSSCNVVADNDYFLNAGKWGYVMYCASNQTIDSVNSTVALALSPGYSDDFTFDFGWTVNSTATTGAWQRVIPSPTDYNGLDANPGIDVPTDCANMAYVTGNSGNNSSDDDIDGGFTELKSPLFDLSSYAIPYINYSRWFFNNGGNSDPNDSLCIYISNGTQTALVEYVLASTPGNSTWVSKGFRISDFVVPSSTMRLIVRTADDSPGHIVEAGFDKFYISEGPSGVETVIMDKSSIQAYPNPFADDLTLSYTLNNGIVAGAAVCITDISGRTVSRVPLVQASGAITLNAEFEAGVYFVRIMNGDESTEPVKVVKMK